MKIQLILESIEECLALARYIRFCFYNNNVELRWNICERVVSNPTFEIREIYDLTIIVSHFEYIEEGKIYLKDLGFEILRSFARSQKSVLVLYEKIESELPQEWVCFLKIPWQSSSLKKRIKGIVGNKIIPTQQEIDELNRLYPPIVFDHHHHHRRSYGQVW